MIVELLLIISLMAPPILYFIEKILPYPYLIEEITKYFIIHNLVHRTSSPPSYLKIVIVIAVIFAFSENILYLPGIISSGGINFFYLRLIIDGTLHLTTFLLMFFGQTRSRLFGIITLLMAIIVHYLFNLFFVVIIP